MCESQVEKVLEWCNMRIAWLIIAAFEVGIEETIS